MGSGALKLHIAILLLIAASQRSAVAEETPAVEFPVGTVVPKVTCLEDPKQSYALYLPSAFSATRKWPIIYVFDPFARGRDAAEIVRAAAEKLGYIVAASNNSKNGAMGGSKEAAEAVWQDTHQRLPIDPTRQYFAGLSGGARVATSLALSCGGCAAGVIANAAGFPVSNAPSGNIKFAYFATVGDADFNYAEFAQLRPKLDSSGARYLIRTFEGPHGWAPPDVWSEALSWMDLQAMTVGTLPRDPARIKATVDASMSRAKELETRGDLLAAVREYKAIARNFGDLTDVTTAQARTSELQKNKNFKKAEKHSARISPISRDRPRKVVAIRWWHAVRLAASLSRHTSPGRAAWTRRIILSPCNTLNWQRLAPPIPRGLITRAHAYTQLPPTKRACCWN